LGKLLLRETKPFPKLFDEGWNVPIDFHGSPWTRAVWMRQLHVGRHGTLHSRNSLEVLC
jgi:hypothetical protein